MNPDYSLQPTFLAACWANYARRACLTDRAAAVEAGVPHKLFAYCGAVYRQSGLRGLREYLAGPDDTATPDDLAAAIVSVRDGDGGVA